MILADRLLNIPYARQVKDRFEKALEEEFTTQDGTILPIRSELTGFTVGYITPVTKLDSNIRSRFLALQVH